jgi:putative exosortase-associated protein (TIGR04073 family)
MRNNLFLFGSLALVAILSVGCAGPEEKMGRGVGNMGEIVRMGEFEKSAQDAGLFDGEDTGLATGMARGFDRSLARTGVGIYEVVTFPLPPYGPVWTSYLSPQPQYPDSFHPRKWSDAMFDSDRMSGFSGGDVAPWFPGSHFYIFDN